MQAAAVRRVRVACATAVLAGAAVSAAPAQARPAPGSLAAPIVVVTTLTDDRIVEASALVSGSATDGRACVANDKGNAPLVYCVDLETGQTYGTVRMDGVEVVDSEAMAAAGDGKVWLGDIGDNDEVRETVNLMRAPYPDAGASSVRPRVVPLRYPDGPHDAETLLVNRSTGVRWIVTKEDTAGVYRVPADAGPEATSTLVEVAGVNAPANVTDGVVLRGGRGLVLRTHDIATVYDLPGWQRIGAFALPPQPQGEAITHEHGRALLITSEGLHPDVLRARIPRALWRQLD